jgi:hypothetical protein
LTRTRWTFAAIAATVLVSLPAAAYLPPATAILKRLAERRADAGLSAMEVRGALSLTGEGARRVSVASGLTLAGSDLALPAVLLLKTPGRCRLEVALEGVTASGRPAVTVRGGRAVSHRGLGESPGALALAEGVCALLGDKGAGGGIESQRAIARRLAGRGIDLRDVAIGRIGGRVAWVMGGRPREARPQAWVDKQSFQPIRLLAPLAGEPRDVRLLEFGSPITGDAFPHVVEVWRGSELEARFTAEKLTANPRIPDAVF